MSAFVIDKEFMCVSAKSQTWQSQGTLRRFPCSIKLDQEEEDGCSEGNHRHREDEVRDALSLVSSWTKFLKKNPKK